jgi:superfamily II DNA or RNA helicase
MSDDFGKGSAVMTRVALSYERGSLVVAGFPPQGAPLPELLVWDARVQAHRCLAIHYRTLVRRLTRDGTPFHDGARQYPALRLDDGGLPAPYPFQQEALAAWTRARRGVVELPTGSGKTQLALRALCSVQRGALILAPTLDLVAQWATTLEASLGIQPGLVGGGSYDLQPVTVSTYASAFRKGELFGERFCLAVFDECHHLSGEGYARIAEVLLAPYRLGLSATVERPDARHKLLDGLIGPVVYRRSIHELSGRYLADYRVETIYAELDPAEREEYEMLRGRYLAFAREHRLTPSSPQGWQRFVFAASRTAEGRQALQAFYRQRQIAFAPRDKLTRLADLLARHRGERVLIFTNDNQTAYEVARRFLLPIITHQTGVAERRTILTAFRENRWPFLVTSRVLNEGIDVPAANVAVILSGTASVREHVQRLGRILRKAPGKEAVLFELLARTTGEERISQRRRQHDAYR